MQLAIIVFLILIFAYQQAPKDGPFHEDYLSKQTTRTVQGVFVVMVFLRHFLDYYPCTAAIDKLLANASSYIGQLLIVPFFFVTGYGTMASIERRGVDYVREIPQKKILKLLVRFDIWVLLFAAYGLIIGKKYTLRRILLSLTGWVSVGNSNWYVLIILVFYILAYLAFRWSRNQWVSVSVTTVLIIGFALFLKQYQTPHWYNTIFVLPCGMIYYMLKDRVDGFIHSHERLYPFIISLLVLLFAGVKQLGVKRNFLFYEIWACLFALILVVKSMKFKLSNRFFDFLGSHVFSIYIIQRIPMDLFSRIKFKPTIFGFLASFAATVIMAVLFDELTAWVEKRIGSAGQGGS